jgi:hypothetical protein
MKKEGLPSIITKSSIFNRISYLYTYSGFNLIRNIFIEQQTKLDEIIIEKISEDGNIWIRKIPMDKE